MTTDEFYTTLCISGSVLCFAIACWAWKWKPSKPSSLYRKTPFARLPMDGELDVPTYLRKKHHCN